jgi:hypothetical protein
MPSLAALAGLADLLFPIWFMIFNAVWLAILICLENSFWHVQQGSSAQDGFVKALNLYSTTTMDKYFISQETNDWFATKRSPSKAECNAFKNDILANHLCKSYLYLLWTYTLEISSPPWTSSLAFDSCLLVLWNVNISLVSFIFLYLYLFQVWFPFNNNYLCNYYDYSEGQKGCNVCKSCKDTVIAWEILNA